MSLCPCGSQLAYDECCRPLLAGERQAETPEALMRSRYCAFVERAYDYLAGSLHPAHRADYDAAATRRWAENAEWLGLEILSTEGGGPTQQEGTVEFIALYKEQGLVKRHHEQSRFQRVDGRWYFVDGEVVSPGTRVRQQPRVGRNAPCPCGSGKKFKKCCGR
ncbi:MAG TPA: YchJ family protein [Sedimenticola sp.]|nr:YchJ family protein [Sedimenticola sp.]